MFRYIFVAFSLCAQVISAEYYSSVESMKELLVAEEYLISITEQYFLAEDLKRLYIEDFLDLVQRNAVVGSENAVRHYGNPISALKTIKRITKDWRDLYKFNSRLKSETDLAENWATLSKDDFKWPLAAELIGAAKGVARLQRVYKLPTVEMANGTLLGRNCGMEMLASDCYVLGHSLLQAQEEKLAVSWLLEARKKLKQGIAQRTPTFPLLSEDTIMQHLTPAVIQSGNTKLGLFLVREQLARSPNDQAATASWAKAYQQIFAERLHIPSSSVTGVTAERAQQRAKESELDENIIASPNGKVTFNDAETALTYEDTVDKTKLSVTELFERTCRGDLEPTPRQKRDLRCRYVHNNVPFCRIAPFKREELSLDPAVNVYYNVIYDGEIHAIINYTTVRLERSRVGLHTEDNQVSEIRTSQQTGIYLTEKFLQKLLQRLKDLTGLRMESAEALQVVNYGIGGHYSPHHDYSDDGFNFSGAGNRLATALFYINEVDMGGGTAFPLLHLAVPPQKYSMVLWHNLHKSLELDYRTLHAGCPVLKGSKWVCNEWFHERQQELMCDLQPDGHKSLQHKARGYT